MVEVAGGRENEQEDSGEPGVELGGGGIEVGGESDLDSIRIASDRQGGVDQDVE